jgi:hypothetical protein
LRQRRRRGETRTGAERSGYGDDRIAPVQYVNTVAAPASLNNDPDRILQHRLGSVAEVDQSKRLDSVSTGSDSEEADADRGAGVGCERAARTRVSRVLEEKLRETTNPILTSFSSGTSFAVLRSSSFRLPAALTPPAPPTDVANPSRLFISSTPTSSSFSPDGGTPTVNLTTRSD